MLDSFFLPIYTLACLFNNNNYTNTKQNMLLMIIIINLDFVLYLLPVVIKYLYQIFCVLLYGEVVDWIQRSESYGHTHTHKEIAFTHSG